MSGMISVDEALGNIIAGRPPRRMERVPLANALGATLAEPVSAKLSRPPTAVSAMDGYAVRLKDVREPGATLKVTGEAPAGTPYAGSVGSGQAVRIFTGGEVPRGADHVIMQEETERQGEVVTCVKGYDASAFVREEGLDFKTGEVLLAANTRVGAAELAVAAAANHDHLAIWKRPRVALLANGDELKQPGSTLSAGQIVNSNPAGLSALITQWGGVPVDLGIAADTIEDIIAHIAREDDADIIVPVGGASVGDHDHMRAAFSAAGFALVFEKIAVKPGKPTWMATKKDQRVLGLPGNPASALVCAHLFLRTLIEFGSGLQTIRATSAAPISANGPRESFLRASCVWSTSGQLEVTPHDNQDSSLLTPFLTANCLIRRTPNAVALQSGNPLDIMLLSPPQ